VKFTHHGMIEVEVTELTDRANPNFPSHLGVDEFPLHVIVRDSGTGIAEDRQGLLFKEFSQLDPGDARKYGGSGLGLAICRKLARLRGGEIWYTPVANGRGSEFHFVILFKRPHRKTPGTDTLQSPSDVLDLTEFLKGSHVLVVEDSRINAMLVSALLGKYGLEPETVANGALAIEKTEEKVWDIIFMDVQMPEIDGLECTRLIRRAEQRLGQKPAYIIALTADAMQGDAQRCLDAGMNDYLSKPLKHSELVAALLRYCQHSTDGGIRG
jgi:two-component system, sensor histidine kinase